MKTELLKEKDIYTIYLFKDDNKQFFYNYNSKKDVVAQEALEALSAFNEDEQIGILVYVQTTNTPSQLELYGTPNLLSNPFNMYSHCCNDKSNWVDVKTAREYLITNMIMMTDGR